jgi:hypothetical protein
MSDSFENEPTESAHTPGDSPAQSGKSRASKGAAKSQQWLMVVALVIAVTAVVLVAAVLIWFRPSSGHAAGSFDDKQVADAKSAVCMASRSVRLAVVRNTHLQNPQPDNPIGTLAVMANARLALSASGSYLHDRLESEEATPQELADSVQALATTLEGLGISYLAGEPNEARETLRKDLDTQIKEVDKLCGE